MRGKTEEEIRERKREGEENTTKHVEGTNKKKIFLENGDITPRSAVEDEKGEKIPKEIIDRTKTGI